MAMNDDCEDQADSSSKLEMSLYAGGGQGAARGPWTIKAYNKKVLKGWKMLRESTPSDAARFVKWLTQDAMQPIPGRCYPLKGKAFVGIWAYEIGSGNRIYYRPNPSTKIAIVYYAGPHPATAPTPPKDLEG
jgi:hypothetical protein